jgi:hypothetical protein
MDEPASIDSPVENSDSGMATKLWEWIFPLVFTVLIVFSASINYRRDGDLLSSNQTTPIAISFLCVFCARESCRRTLAFAFCIFWLALGFVLSR